MQSQLSLSNVDITEDLAPSIHLREVTPLQRVFIFLFIYLLLLLLQYFRTLQYTCRTCTYITKKKQINNKKRLQTHLHTLIILQNLPRSHLNKNSLLDQELNNSKQLQPVLLRCNHFGHHGKWKKVLATKTDSREKSPIWQPMCRDHMPGISDLISQSIKWPFYYKKVIYICIKY